MKLFVILFLLIEQGVVFGQTPEIKHNYTRIDSAQSPLIDSFAKNYDFIIAFTEQSYWWASAKNYRILAYSENGWTCWTYSNNFVTWKKKKRRSKVIVDTVLSGQFFKVETEVQNQNVVELLSDLSEFDFWRLSNDSLNQSRVIEITIADGDTTNRTASISDGVNYRFDLLSKTTSRVIESYEPDYFVKLFPDMIDREQFIKSRQAFLLWWNRYCH